MSDLVEFLEARLDEDATEIAKHPDGEDDWEFMATGEAGYPCTPYLMIGKKRALAEVEAKRRILAGHPATTGWDGDGTDQPICLTCSTSDTSGGSEGDPYPCRTLRLLALPYGGHEDYRAEWAA